MTDPTIRLSQDRHLTCAPIPAQFVPARSAIAWTASPAQRVCLTPPTPPGCPIHRSSIAMSGGPTPLTPLAPQTPLTPLTPLTPPTPLALYSLRSCERAARNSMRSTTCRISNSEFEKTFSLWDSRQTGIHSAHEVRVCRTAGAAKRRPPDAQSPQVPQFR
jgi:hypothetical protein